MLALSSLSRNSRYVALFWVSIWIVGGHRVDDSRRRFTTGRSRPRTHVAGRTRDAHASREDAAREAMAARAVEQQQALGRTNCRLEMSEAAKTDWRPLVSYTANLSRVGRQLLGTDAAWHKLSELQPPQMRRRVVLSQLPGPQYPWYWSAGVLAGLFGLSACILNLSVRSLDRLRVTRDRRRVPRGLQVVRQRHRHQQADAARSRRRHRPARPQRRRQIDAAATGDRPALRQPGEGARPGPAGLEQPGAQSPHRPLPGAGRLLRMDDGLGLRPHLRPLAGLSRAAARDAAARTLEAVGMTQAPRTAPCAATPKGMRQRTKLAQALVHDPQVLFLDEPLTGTDPVARHDLMDIIQRLGSEGKSVLVSSHVLHEVQSLTPNIILLNHGRLVAEGHVRADPRPDRQAPAPHRADLRRVPQTGRPHSARGTTSKACACWRKEKGLMVETRTPDAFYSRLPELSLEDGMAIKEVYSDDDNLEASSSTW